MIESISTRNNEDISNSGLMFRLILAVGLVFVGFMFGGLGVVVWVPIAWAILFVLLPISLPSDWIDPIKKFLFTILFFGVLLYGSYFVYGFFLTGAWQGTAIAAEETGVVKATFTGVAYWKDRLLNPEKLAYDYFTWKNPDVVEERPEKGILFTGLETRRDYYDENEPVKVFGTAKVKALPSVDTNVFFECEMDINGTNVTGKMVLLGVEGESVKIYAGYDEVVDFSCEFDDGFEVTKPTQLKVEVPGFIPKVLGGGRELYTVNKTQKFDIQTYKVKVSGIYQDFSTTSDLKIYNLKNEVLRNLEDPFENIKEPLLGSDRKMRSQCLNGCGLTKLALKSSKQPQTDIGTYTLGINLRKDNDWYGELRTLKEVRVRLPDNFDLVECEDFGGDDLLDGFDGYLDSLNKNLEEDKSGFEGITFYCDYEISQPREFIGFDDVLVRAVYDYEVVKKTTVNIVKVSKSESESEVEDDNSDDGDVIGVNIE